MNCSKVSNGLAYILNLDSIVHGRYVSSDQGFMALLEEAEKAFEKAEQDY